MNANSEARQASEDTVPENGTPAKHKRKSEDGGNTQGRTKRNRYISIACNECKRRKIKCNGETPCQRCGNLSLECVYAPNCCSNGFKESDEYRHMTTQLQTLQQQVDSILATLSSIQQGRDAGTIATIEGLPRPSSVGPLDPQIAFQAQTPRPDGQLQEDGHTFSGPTSSAYFLEYANTSLQSMGLPPPGDGVQYHDNSSGDNSAGGNKPGEPTTAKSPLIQVSMLPSQAASASKDPLWCLTVEEVLRLCGVYADEMGSMYPIIDIGKMSNKVRTLFKFLESIRKHGLMKREAERCDSFNDDDTVTLKLVLAAAATVEGNGQSDLGNRLFENVRRIMNAEDKLGKPATIRGLRILVVLACYYFHKDEEVQAYRIVGIAARQCFELGLHRSDVLQSNFPNGEERMWAIRLFWSIYALDRRWSFGTGLPFAMQDADIDPSLPEPDDQVPYLRSMVAYGRIASKVWTSVAGFDNTAHEFRNDSFGYLDFQIQQWQGSLPDILKYSSHDNTEEGQAQLDRGQRRLRLMLYLRANQLRIQLYRPVLYTLSSIMDNRGYTQTVIEIAKDTIRMLTEVNQSSDIYRSQQVSFHYFLVAALAVLFLAVSHAPNEFSRHVREEFYMALGLIKGFSCRSYISKRLWKTVKGLKKVAPKLGLVTHHDPHSSAAVAMAGLAGHTVDENSAFPQVPSLDSSPINGQQLSNELTQLFETAGGYGGFMGTRGDELILNGDEVFDSFSSMIGNEEDFVKIMKECF